MQILSLDIKNHDRIGMEDKEISYAPTNKICLVLGDNGAGKSSFMDLLLPRVVKTEELNAEGYVVLRLTHAGDEYVIATYKDNNRYSFLKNKEELNTKSRPSVQALLIKEHINIDGLISDVLKDKLKFTQLPVQKRREVLELLSGNNYTLINDLHKNLTKKLTAANAISDFNAKKLSEATSQMSEIASSMDEVTEDANASEQRITELYKKLDMEHKDVLPAHIQEWLDKGEYLMATHARYTKRYKSFVAKHFKVGGVHRAEKFKQLISEQLQVLKGEYESLSKQHRSYIDNLPDIEAFKGLTRLRTTKDDAEKTKRTLEASSAFDRQYLDYPLQELKDFMLSNRDKLHNLSVIDDLHTYYNTPYPMDEKEIASDKELLGRIEEEISILDKALYHLCELRDSGKTTCPKCKHEFAEGYSEDEHNKKINRKDELKAEFTVIKARVERAIEIGNRITLSRQAYAEYNRLTNVDDNPSLHVIKTAMDERFYEGTKGMDGYISTTLVKIEHAMKYNDVVRKIREVSEQIDTLVQIDMASVSEQKEKIKAIEIAMACNRRTNRDYNALIEVTTTSINQRDALLAIEKEMKHASDTLRELADWREKTLIQQHIRERIKKEEARYARLKTLSIRAKGIRERLTTATEDLAASEADQRAYKRLADILNPKGKVIARSIRSFINLYIDNMNGVIAGVWKYPLTVSKLPDAITQMTYRFAFKANGKVRKDISLASTATGDVLDIAFKLTAMDCIGMNDAPLLLDEVGNGYDTEHVHKLCEYIVSLSKMSYSNIFIVAHEESTYGYFNDKLVDKVILSDISGVF